MHDGKRRKTIWFLGQIGVRRPSSHAAAFVDIVTACMTGFCMQMRDEVAAAGKLEFPSGPRLFIRADRFFEHRV